MTLKEAIERVSELRESAIQRRINFGKSARASENTADADLFYRNVCHEDGMIHCCERVINLLRHVETPNEKVSDERH